MSEEEYKVSIVASGANTGPFGYAYSPAPLTGMKSETMQALWPKLETKDVTNKEIETQLKGLMLAFEKSATANYGVKKAKTTLTVTKAADGRLELSLGLGIFKVFDAEGKVKGEVTQGIEIEIEKREK